MPWTVSGVVEKRKEFLTDLESGDWTMSELCRIYGISRPTGYAVLDRYGAGGEAGLEELSCAPRRHPNQTPGEIEQLVLGLRRQHPLWGPRPLKKVLGERQQQLVIPAASTIGAIVDREGLTRHRPKRRRVEPYQQPFAAVEGPHDEWGTDFRWWTRPTPRGCRPSSRRRFASTGCPGRCARTTGPRLLPVPWRVCRGCRCGGSSSASGRSASPPATPSRTGGTNACTAP